VKNAFFAAALAASLAASAVQAQVITRWNCWGPGWGRGGLGAVSNGLEASLRPQPGDLHLSLRTDIPRLRMWQEKETGDGVLRFLSEQFPETKSKWETDGATPWAGATLYAATYIRAPEKTAARLIVTSTPRAPAVWLNGVLVSGREISLEKGWNCLLIKSLGAGSITIGRTVAATPSYWTLKAEITAPARVPLTFALADPERVVLLADGQPLRFLSSITTTAKPFAIYLEPARVVLPYAVTAAVGPAAQFAVGQRVNGLPWVYTTAPQAAGLAGRSERKPLAAWAELLPAQLAVTLIDYDGNTVDSRTVPLAFKPSKNGEMAGHTVLDYGVLPPGHYTLRSVLKNRAGQVVLRDNDHSLAVLRGAVDRKTDTGIRRLSCTGHWLFAATEPQFSQAMGRLDFLHDVGITRQVKVNQSLGAWGLRHDGQGQVTLEPRPELDRFLDKARQLDIEIVGDLGVGYPLDDALKNGLPPLIQAEQETILARAQAMTAGRPMTLQPVGLLPLPPYGSTYFDATLRRMATLMAQTYKGRVASWCGDNEIDLHVGAKAPKATAELYAHATRIVHDAIKAADPRSGYSSGSLARESAFTTALFANGYATAQDMLDIHAHPADAPQRLSAPALGNSPNEDLGTIPKRFSDRPVIYGELSAPLAHSPDGVKGQAEAVVKQLCWAINHPRVRALAYLVVYGSPTYGDANLGFNNKYGDPHPGVNALNTASHLIDGRRRLPDLKGLPETVQHLVVDNPQGNATVVLWNPGRDLQVTVPVNGKTARKIDVIGRSIPLTVTDGCVTTIIGNAPCYLQW